MVYSNVKILCCTVPAKYVCIHNKYRDYLSMGHLEHSLLRSCCEGTLTTWFFGEVAQPSTHNLYSIKGKAAETIRSDMLCQSFHGVLDNYCSHELFLYYYWYYVIILCMYVHTYSKSMDQPGKVANPARGQLNRKNEYFPVRVRA